MNDCPPKLRGDLSKWLFEINTGVYVGQISGRVRDAIWERVCKNLNTGRATMVFTTNNEQRMDFRVHNTAWEPVDFDGLKLMRRPLQQNSSAMSLMPGFSNAAKHQMAEHRQRGHLNKNDCYVVIDFETTGLHPETDRVIEYGAVRVENGVEKETFSKLVNADILLPQTITQITGITDHLLQVQGENPKLALDAFLQFIGQDKLIGYNISFDLEFLQAECQRFRCQMPANRSVDLLKVVRRKIRGVSDYKLYTLAEHFSLPLQQSHRALPDCKLTYAIYEKLKEK